jgi:hypothetical protein
VTTITHRRAREPGEVDERYVLLRFTDGLIVDPRRCPAGIMARGHWSLTEGLRIPGEPNAECGCPKREAA